MKITMIGILFLCWISTIDAVSKPLSWTVETSVPTCKEDLKLTCTVLSNCCSSSARIWTRGDGTQLLNDGVSLDPKKYVEELEGTNGFSLIIKSLDSDDVNVEYNCLYSVFNDSHTLSSNKSWECPPPDLCPKEVTSTRGNDNKLEFNFTIEEMAPEPSYFASFGDENITSDLTVTFTNFDTWLYRSQCSMKVTVNCHNDQDFSLGFITGTETTTICKQVNLCYPCWKCGLWYYLFSVGAVFIEGPILIFFIYLICFRYGDSDSWQIRKYFCFKDEDVADGNTYILYGKAYGKKKGRRAILKAVILTFIGHTVFFSLLYPFLSVGTYCPTCKSFTEIAAIVFGLGGSMFCINFYVALLISREETSSCLQWLYCILIMVVVNLLFPLPFLIFYYYLKDDDTCKKALFFIGCVLLAILILPIPLMIIYYHLKKSFKYVKANNESNVELPSPYQDANGEVTWSKINGKMKIRYSKGTEIEQRLPQELGSRLHVKGGHLCISDVKESDEGIYECLTLTDGEAAVPEVSKLQLIVSYDENHMRNGERALDGGKSQSVESGSSCWPICRVGQDPNTPSSNPEKVRRSPEKERVDIKQDKKPTKVVRPQPSRPLPPLTQHLRTDNTGREQYSTEIGIYKPRLLPSIGDHSDSPRSLPKRTKEDQLQKGDMELKPVGDSTPERKKRRKRKKKETKQSHEDD